jgi:hypothetical protein
MVAIACASFLIALIRDMAGEMRTCHGTMARECTLVRMARAPGARGMGTGKCLWEACGGVGNHRMASGFPAGLRLRSVGG